MPETPKMRRFLIKGLLALLVSVVLYSPVQSSEPGEKELLELNRKIKEALERNDFKGTLPLYEKSIEILRKIGRRQNLYEALRNYQAMRQRVLTEDAGELGLSGSGFSKTSVEQPSSSYEAAVGSRSTNIVRLPHGNLTPYRKDAISRIAKNWNLAQCPEPWAATLDISKDGKIQAIHMTVSPLGSQRTDVIRVLERTVFAPLPDWYKESILALEVNSTTIMSLVSENNR